MKIKLLIYIIISYFVFLLPLIPENLFAEGSIGTSGADFLELGIGSKPLSMGEAFTAAVEDINSIYYNPAGISTLKYPLLSIMHQELILNSRFENISLAVPMYRGFMGVSSSVFWVPPFEKIDINGNDTGDVQFYNMSNIFSYGQSLGFIHVGGSLKYIYQKIDTLQLHSLAFDFGILKKLYMFSPFDAPIKNFFLGFSVQNIGTKAKKDKLPRTIRIGTSYLLTKWISFNMDVSEYFITSSDLYDFTYGFDESFRINTGIELSYLDIISFRAGYRFNDAGTYSFGLGFNFVVKNINFLIDTSYSENGIFGPVYSFGVTFKLIPKVITVHDQLMAEKHYQKGIKNYIFNDFESAINEFKTSHDYNPYHKNVKEKINDLEELQRLKEINEELEEEIKEKNL